ncbi:cold-shock protein [Sphaerobacter thermophilus]|jgi:CspA family cold shock protein|uniref:Cold-shock DNA-binding domain protein n=1 Tax=Sphaerobacter thermophilus (strain ATCC 49802 / DSM 20745 / KCCM 41009 / NCIMB 13125 / S 6022) TaxID=479434 RepID=D1C6U7_SPHTD|nr:cold-shock protein [Sphaerobacter thermophilus]ACZ37708.1 cold-shock DNA-binding domain protein [Sphaerobacter thermophilus DSM 20745]PZN67815.1 MAG: cold-shock protein [Sphaerobacter thermophilus]
MTTGTVKWYDPEKGYGFIARDDGDSDLFVHRSAISGSELNEGDRVEFDVTSSPKGPRAEHVRVTEPNLNPPRRRRYA